MGASRRKVQDIFSFALSNTQDKHVLSGFAHPRSHLRALPGHSCQACAGVGDLSHRQATLTLLLLLITHHEMLASHTAPTSVHSIDDIKVTAAVTNTGSEAIKVLKYGTVLDGDMPTRSFAVSKDGVHADFTGIKISVDLEQIGEEAFVTIPAGETVTVSHDGQSTLSPTYFRTLTSTSNLHIDSCSFVQLRVSRYWHIHF